MVSMLRSFFMKSRSSGILAFRKQRFRLSSESSRMNQTDNSAGTVDVLIKSSEVLPDDLQLLPDDVNSNAGKSTLRSGMTGRGVVTSLGSQVKCDAKVGDEVFVVHHGTWSSAPISVPSECVFKVPEVLTEGHKSTFFSSLIAWGLLTSRTVLKKGDIVIQNNGDSNVGRQVKVLGKALGLTVLDVSEANLDAGLAKLVICGDTPEKGFRKLLKMVEKTGTVATYSGTLSSSGVMEIPVSASIFSDVTIVGFSLVQWSSSENENVRTAIEALAPILANTKEPEVKGYSIEQYDEALAAAVDVSPGKAAKMASTSHIIFYP